MLNPSLLTSVKNLLHMQAYCSSIPSRTNPVGHFSTKLKGIVMNLGIATDKIKVPFVELSSDSFFVWTYIVKSTSMHT